MDRAHTKRLRALPALATLLLIGACASLTGTRESFTVYAPRYEPPSKAAEGKPVDWQLAIDTPLASDALDTSRMLVMPTPGALETYKGGRWADTPPLVLRGLLIEAFQETGRIAGVGAVTSGIHADYTMTIDLYDFEVQYRDGAPHALIRLNAKLNDASINRVRAARTFEADEPVSGTTAGDAAAAFDRAIDALLADVVRWTIDQGESAWSGMPHASRSPP
jgi:cholesterol transport system auxiliary component